MKTAAAVLGIAGFLHSQHDDPFAAEAACQHESESLLHLRLALSPIVVVGEE